MRTGSAVFMRKSKQHSPSPREERLTQDAQGSMCTCSPGLEWRRKQGWGARRPGRDPEAGAGRAGPPQWGSEDLSRSALTRFVL